MDISDQTITEDDSLRGQERRTNLLPVDPSSFRFYGQDVLQLTALLHSMDISNRRFAEDGSPRGQAQTTNLLPADRSYHSFPAEPPPPTYHYPPPTYGTNLPIPVNDFTITYAGPNVPRLSAIPENGLYCENQGDFPRHFTLSRGDPCLNMDRNIPEMNQTRTCATSSFHTSTPNRCGNKRRQPSDWPELASASGTSKCSKMRQNASSGTDGSCGNWGSDKSVNDSNASFTDVRGDYRCNYLPPRFEPRADNNGQALRDEIPSEHQVVAAGPTREYGSASTAGSRLYHRKSRNASRLRNIPECSYCSTNRETREFRRSHVLKRWDEASQKFVLTCPVLRRYVCPTCHATDDVAHSNSRCPEVIRELGYRPTPMSQLRMMSLHDSNGRRKRRVSSPRPR